MENLYDHVPTVNRISYEDREDWLNKIEFLPTLAGHQHSDPECHCEPRIIGEFELIYFIGGQGTVIIQDVLYDCRAGDIILIRPYEVHAIKSSREYPHDNFWVHFDISPVHLSQPFVEGQFPDGYRKINIGIDEQLIQSYADLLYEIARKRAGYISMVNHLFSMIMVKMIRRIQNHRPEIIVHTAEPTHSSLLQIQKAERYILEHYQQDISIQHIAHHLSIGPSYLFRLFHDCLQTTPIRYLTQTRMKKAEYLMKTTELTIGEIAMGVGYVDPFYFSKTFKRVYGVSPSQYIRQMHY